MLTLNYKLKYSYQSILAVFVSIANKPHRNAVIAELIAFEIIFWTFVMSRRFRFTIYFVGVIRTIKSPITHFDPLDAFAVVASETRH